MIENLLKTRQRILNNCRRNSRNFLKKKLMKKSGNILTIVILESLLQLYLGILLLHATHCTQMLVVSLPWFWVITATYAGQVSVSQLFLKLLSNVLEISFYSDHYIKLPPSLLKNWVVDFSFCCLLFSALLLFQVKTSSLSDSSEYLEGKNKIHTLIYLKIYSKGRENEKRFIIDV